MSAPLASPAAAGPHLRAEPEVVRGPRRVWELVTLLAHREVAGRYRNTILGWSWPLVRQGAQLGILVFVFTAALDLGIEDYPLFVFTGLIAWSWFSAGVDDAAWSLIANRHLVFRPGFPTVVLPFVSVATRFIDVLLALPILAAMIVLGGHLDVTAALFPLVVLLQALLMIGIGLLVSAISARFRDVPNLVSVVNLMLFYLTPVFYDLDAVPTDYQWILELNPVGVLIEAYRDVLIYGNVPDLGSLAAVTALATALCAAGWALFRRLSDDFVDVL